MRGTIDYSSEGIRLFGQPLATTLESGPHRNPLMCCVPTSTATSSFIHGSTLKFIKFAHILHVELVRNGSPNDIELTFVHSVKGNTTSEYPTTKTKYNVHTQVVTMDNLSDRVWSGEELVTELMTRAYPMGRQNRMRMLVLINPNSGQGHALRLFRKETESILKAAKCEVTVQMTQYQGHAREIARDVNIDAYDFIVCCSGDGIPHEVINGLYARDDRVAAFTRMKVVQIPGGSGNAMTLSCLGTSEPSEAAIRLLKGKIVQCDLMAVSGWKGKSQDVLVSFLSQTYGIIAQADIGTEALRFLGKMRFDVGVFLEVVQNKKYPCKLAVKCVTRDKRELGAHYKAQQSCSEDIEPISEENFKLKYVDQFHGAESFTDLPEGWEMFDQNKMDHNAIFYSGKMPYIASECNFFPAALPNDGAIDIVTFDGRTRLMSTAEALLSLDKGLHVWKDDVEHFKVEAFRLAPESNDRQRRYISVDGEDYPFGPFQVEVLPRVMHTVLWREEGFTETGFAARL